MTTITHLPQEMIDEVFKHIRGVKDVVAFARTCKMAKTGMKDSFASLEFDKVQTVSASEYLKNKELYPPNLLFSLNLYCCDVTDVSALGGVHILNLSYCIVTDVSALGRVHTLDLSYCHIVTDVSALGRVHTLDLTYCTGVTDISALGGVHKLNLFRCGGVTDVIYA
jgi:hypothetical protein